MNITKTIPKGLPGMRQACKNLPLQIIISSDTTMPTYIRDKHTNQLIPTGSTYNPSPAKVQAYLSASIAKLKRDNPTYKTIVVRRKRQVISILDSESISRNVLTSKSLHERISDLNPVRIDGNGG